MPVQRGRKSAAALAIVPAFARDQRPEPPAELTAEQAQTWQDIVASMPSDWFRAGTHVLLSQFCRHVATSRILADQINAFQLEWLELKDGMRRYDRLLAMHDRESKAMSSLATKLRLTQQSRYTPQAAATAVRDSRLGLQPWEKHT